MKPIPVRMTCNPEITEAVLVVGEEPDAVSIGIPVEQIPRLIEQAIIAHKLIQAERQRPPQ